MAAIDARHSEPKYYSNNSSQKQNSDFFWVDEFEENYNSDCEVFEEPKTAEIKKFHSHVSTIQKVIFNKIDEEEIKFSDTPQFCKINEMKNSDFSKSLNFGRTTADENYMSRIVQTEVKIRHLEDIFEDSEKYVKMVKTEGNLVWFQNDESESEWKEQSNSVNKIKLGLNCQDSTVMFIKLETVLICESREEINNLHLLMCLKKSRKRSSKKKTAREKQNQYIFIYIRPFIKSFLRYVKSNFTLVLYSQKDVETLDSITQRLNEMFEEELFDAYLSMPSTKGKNIDINQFISEEERRSRENIIILDSSPLTWRKNRYNCVPITVFEGYPKDSTLFLWEKFIQKMVESDSMLHTIKNAFYESEGE